MQGRRVDARGIVMKKRVRKLKGLLLGNLAVEDHPGKCGGERCARRLNGQPIVLFRPNRFVERESIRAKNDLVRIEQQPMTQDHGEVLRIQIDTHQGGVEIDILPRRKPDCLLLERISTVQQHEVHVAVAGVTQHVLEIENVATGYAEKVPSTHGRVDLHGKM